MTNVEVKARVADVASIRRRLPGLGFRRERPRLAQTDWYFTVPRGRLKLRQRKGDTAAELIFYVRPDRQRPRGSEFQKLPVDDPPHALRLLRAMFTPGVVVRKTRELWLREDVRVHLDSVRYLGTFLEIEVPVRAGRPAAEARRIMRALVRALGITPASILAVSYADLIAQR